MKPARYFKTIITGLAATFLCSCIHEYPFATNVPSTPAGEDPTAVSTYIEVIYDLSWENMIHKVEFSTKATGDRNHRFIIEVRENGETVLKDIVYLSEEEFSGGNLRHRLSQTLGAKKYEMAVWYDYQGEDGEYPYRHEILEDVMITSFSTTDAEGMRCGYGKEMLDLAEFQGSEETNTHIKRIELQHPVARFEIVATDIQDFISDQKVALEQGESFSTRVTLSGGAYGHYNVYGENILKGDSNLELTGRMRLPFAEYEELTIAEGVFFSKEEDEVTAKLTVMNSSLVTVSQTDYFTFPVKRGYITTIKGDFLTHPLEGVFSVNNIWEGEIIYEIE